MKEAPGRKRAENDKLIPFIVWMDGKGTTITNKLEMGPSVQSKYS